jgi:hypothetical protein
VVAAGVVAASVLLLASASLAASGVSAAQRQRFNRIDRALTVSALAFTNDLNSISYSASAATFHRTISKPAAAYEAALSGFNTGLAALHLRGAAGSDETLVVKDDRHLETVLAASGHDTQVVFRTALAKVLTQMDGSLQERFRYDLGLPATNLTLQI